MLVSQSLVLAGMLDKKGTGGLVDSWSLRLFELYRAHSKHGNPTIAYWHQGQMKGIVHLFRGSSVYQIPKQPTRFNIVNCKLSNRPGDETSLELRALTEGSCTAWIDAIRNIVAVHNASELAASTLFREVAFDKRLIQHRRYHFKQYHDCVIAAELVGALVVDGHAPSREEAVQLCQELVRIDELHHVCDDHPFEDSSNFYRFTVDDTILNQRSRADFPAPFHKAHDTPESVYLVLEKVSRVAYVNGLIRNRWYHLIRYDNCLIASELVTHLVADGCAPSREEAVQLCQELVQNDELHHVCDDHPFEDSSNFYRFTSQESESARLARLKNPSVFTLQTLLEGCEELVEQDLRDSELLDISNMISAAVDQPGAAPEHLALSERVPSPNDSADNSLHETTESELPFIELPKQPAPTTIQAVASQCTHGNRWAGAVVLAVAYWFQTGGVWLSVFILGLAAFLSHIARQRRIAVNSIQHQILEINQQNEKIAKKNVKIAEKSAAEQNAKIAERKAKIAERKANSATQMADCASTNHKQLLHELPSNRYTRTPSKIHSAQALKVFVFGAAGAKDALPVDVNKDSEPVPVDGPEFKGRMVVRVLGLEPHTKYFDGKSRRFSIQIQGVFTEDVCVQDLEFGAVFDKEITLPFGSSIGLALAHKIDPALREDLEGPKPWMMSPLLCAMNRMKVSQLTSPTPADGVCGPWIYGGSKRLEEDSVLALPRSEKDSGYKESKRRKFFENKHNRLTTKLSKNMMYDFEFLSSLVDFTTFEVKLGIRKSVLPYLNGQPVRFEARLKDKVIFGCMFDGSQLKM